MRLRSVPVIRCHEILHTGPLKELPPTSDYGAVFFFFRSYHDSCVCEYPHLNCVFAFRRIGLTFVKHENGDTGSIQGSGSKNTMKYPK